MKKLLAIVLSILLLGSSLSAYAMDPAGAEGTSSELLQSGLSSDEELTEPDLLSAGEAAGLSTADETGEEDTYETGGASETEDTANTTDPADEEGAAETEGTAEADARSDSEGTDSLEGVTEEASAGSSEDMQESDPEAEVLQEDALLKAEAMRALDYIYVEYPYLETPGTQHVVVAWTADAPEFEDLRIYIQKESDRIAGNDWTDTAECLETVCSADGARLFERTYSDKADAGTYYVAAIELVRETGRAVILPEELGQEVKFGVDQIYSGAQELQPLDENAVLEEVSPEDVDIAVINLEEDGTVVEESCIEETLESASDRMDEAEAYSHAIPVDTKDGISAGLNDALQKQLTATTGNVVVALDPGHDSTHAGATRNGAREEVLTLKIANYCKAELETYKGVSVYMTRTTAACPYPGTSSSGADIAKRVAAAKAAGAKIYVSIHLNASTSTTPKGAEVIIPNTSWKKDLNTQGKALATAILKQLTALGLEERTIYTRNASDGSKYSDGSVADYYAVQYHGKKNGIPGIIVEHAFISNASDYKTFLSTDAGLKSLGVADAKGIANYLGLQKNTDPSPVMQDTYLICSALNTGKCLSIADSGTSVGSKAVLAAKGKLGGQTIQAVSLGNDKFQLISTDSKKALGVSGELGTAKEEVKLQTPSKTAKGQQWTFADAGSGYYYIQAYSGYMLCVKDSGTSDGTPVWTSTKSTSKAQKWKLVTKPVQNVANGDYTLVSAVGTSRILGYSGTNVQLATPSNSLSVYVKYIEDGYYRLKMPGPNKAIELAGGGTADHTNIQLAAWNGSDRQLWRFIDRGDGTYTIQSKLGPVIDVRGGYTTVGNNIQGYHRKDSKPQKWTLKKVTGTRTIANGTYCFVNASNQRQVLDVRGGYMENKINVQSWEYNATDKQRFQVTYLGNGYYKIINVKTGKSLDVAGASKAVGANVQQYTYNASYGQQWKFVDAGSGRYYIQSRLGKIIDLSANLAVNKLNAYMEVNEGLISQKWYIRKTTDMPALYEKIPAGTYCINSALDSDMMLDVRGGSKENKANIQLYHASGKNAQKFKIVAVSGGWYKIINVGSNKVVDVTGGSTKSGTNVQQYSWNNTDKQLWRFIDAGGGKYYIQSKLGTYLNVCGSKTADHTNITAYRGSGCTAQKWVLKDPAEVADTLLSTAGATMTKQQMFDFFVSKGLTPAGAAGLMGNLQAESGLSPINLENSKEKKLGYTDASYTKAVDNGTYKNFVKDSSGYGLAQWTFYSRKQKLLDYAHTKKTSIGNAKMQCEFIIKELKEDHASVYKTLTTSSNIKTCSDAVLLNYESPSGAKDLSEERAGYAKTIYNACK